MSVRLNETFFNNWEIAFRTAVGLMGSEGDLTVPARMNALLNSSDRWIRTGAIDGRAFYNNQVYYNPENLLAINNVNWMLNFFTLKYLELINSEAISEKH